MLARYRRFFDLGSAASLVPLLAAIAIGLDWARLTAAVPADFQAFVDAGQALARGADPYGAYTVQFDAPFPNLNPPASLFIFRWFGYVDPVSALHAWYTATVLLYGATVWLLFRLAPERATVTHGAWLLALAGFWHTLESKNLYVALALTTTVVWLLLRDGRDLPAAVLIGLVVALKPNLVVWPLLLLLAGHRRLALTALAATAAASFAALVAYGPESYVQWWTAIGLHTHPHLMQNGSLAGLLARWRLGALTPFASAAMLAAAAWLVLRRGGTERQVSGVAIAAGLFAAPLAWVGYSLLLLPALMDRPWRRSTAVAAALFVVPSSVLLLVDRGDASLARLGGSLYPLAYALVLVGLAAELPVTQRAYRRWDSLLVVRRLLSPETCAGRVEVRADGWQVGSGDRLAGGSRRLAGREAG